MYTTKYAYNGRLWSRCPTTSDNDSFFHSAFGETVEEGEALFDKQAEYKRDHWGTFLKYFKNESMPPCLADILRKCFIAKDKYKQRSIEDTRNLDEYISDIRAGEQAVAKEEIPILAALENVKVVVLDGTPDPVMVIVPNRNILGNYAKQIAKKKPREIVMCLEENVFARLEPISKGRNPKSDQNKTEKKNGSNREYRKGGSAGSKGGDYQVRLIALVILNALKNAVNGWNLSTENKEAGKFDDIVLELPEGDILIQSKHKENNTNTITLKELTSTKKNDDFSLPMYFLSYLQIKKTFNIKNVILCSNAGVNEKALDGEERYLKAHEAHSESLLYHEDGDCIFYKLTDNILPNLLKNTRLYYHKNKNEIEDIEESAITKENLEDFLDRLQMYFNYSSLENLANITGELLSITKYCSNSHGNITSLEMFSKVKDWFQQNKGEYIETIRANAMFVEIWSDRQCHKLEEYKVSFQKNNTKFSNPKQVFHVVTSREHLLQTIKIYRAVRKQKSKILFINPDDDLDTQKLIVQAFVGVPRYIYLIIIRPRTTEKSVTEEIYGELRQIIDKDKYKKIILAAEDSEVAQQIELDDIVQVDSSVAFEDLSLVSQRNLIKKRIINFQENRITLEELLYPDSKETKKDYGKVVNPTVLEKLVKGEEIRVGKSLSVLDNETSECYINRTLKRTLDVKHDTKLENEETKKVFPEETESSNFNNHITHMKNEETLTEESIYNVKEKIILIADSAGTGKTTILAKLASIIKESNPYLWVIRVVLNDFTPILNDFLSKRKETITLEELLNSQNTTKLTNHLEEYLFTLSKKIVLMLDGIDEISPDYIGLILRMLKKYEEEFRFAKIFLTTRPHMVKKLKTVFEVEPFILQPLTEQNQLDYLSNYWAYKLKEDKEDESKEKCKLYAKIMINNVFWTNFLQNDKDNYFTSSPLHLKMSAEIFQENPILTESITQWREYTVEGEDELKLTKRIDVSKLYDLLMKKKQDIFMAKGNPSANLAAKEAFMEQFKKFRVYYQSLALEVILGEDQCHYFSNYPRYDETMETMMLKIGVVQKLNNEFHFVHRTFADYFVAECLLTELQQNRTLEFQMFVIDTIFLYPQYSTTRIFLDNFLLKVIDTLPYTLFENYQSNIQQSNWESFKLQSTLIHLLAGEGCITILQFLLKCIKFETITDKEINIRDCYKTDFDKNIFGNTLNILQYLTREAGINIMNEQGQTPLHLAVKNHNLEMIIYLIKHGVHCNVKDNGGFTALHEAAYYGHLKIVRFLVENGSDIKVTNNDGCTPLNLANEKGHLEVTKYLLEVDMDCNIKDNDGLMVKNS